MKRALILSLRNSDFTEMFRLARSLRDAGAYESLILTYTSAGNDIEYQQRKCDEAGLRLAVMREPTMRQKKVVAAAPPTKKIVSLGDGRLREYAIKIYRMGDKPRQWIFRAQNLFFLLINYFYIFTKQLSQYQKIVHEFKPDILVVAEDIVGLTLPAYIKTGHDADIPSVIVPYTIANAIEAAESLHVYPNYRANGIIGWIIRLFFPRWIYTYKGFKLMRLPAYYIFAHALYRLTPPDPWTMNSGYANAIAIENKHMKSYYMREGFIDAKLRVTGAIYDDTLTAALRDKEARRERLYAGLGLPAGKRLIVVGAPPNQLTTPRPGCPYTSYEAALGDLADLLKDLKEWNVVIRPHPNFMDIAGIFEKRGLHVTEIDTAELIPLADIYIAYASATIRWAVSCGIPSVNYDLFQYGYDDYKLAPGVIHAYQPLEFNDIVRKLATDPVYYLATKQAQESVMHDWGHTDGQSTARMIALFDELTAQHPVPRTPTTKIRR